MKTVRAAIDHAVMSLEIVDSRVASWDIALADTVADNASSGTYVLGSRSSRWMSSNRGDTMEMQIDGEVVSTGNGAACLDDPLAAVAWLARTAQELRRAAAGRQLVLSGALGPMVPVTAGNQSSPPDQTDGEPLGHGHDHLRLGESHGHQSRHHRLGQHRHRPDDQGAATRPTSWRWPRWSASTRTPTAWPARPHGRHDDAQGHRGLHGDAGLRRDRDHLRRDLGRRTQGATRRRCEPYDKRLVDLTPPRSGRSSSRR